MWYQIWVKSYELSVNWTLNSLNLLGEFWRILKLTPQSALLSFTILYSYSITEIKEMSFQESFPGEKIIKKISANWTTVLILISTISSLLSLGWSQTSLYFASAEKRNQKTIANRTIVFFTLMMQVVSKVWQYQL